MRSEHTPPNRETGCEEFRQWTRRRFLGRAALTAAAAVVGPAWMPKVLLAAEPGGMGRDVLVYILLRGGLDGLSTVVPYGDGDLYVARPTLAVPPPGAVGGAIDLDGFFGLNPAAAPLMGPWGAGRLAFVHAAGSPDPSRSHFSASATMEGGVPGQALSAVTSGWVARHLLTTPAATSTSLRGLSLGDLLPTGLYGAPNTLPIRNPSGFDFPGDPSTSAARKATLAAMYGGFAAPLGPAGIDALGTIELLDAIDFEGYAPAGGASYPDTDIGNGLARCAALIKADVGVEVLMLEMQNFDHHATQGPLDGDLAALLADLAQALAAFDTDLGPMMDGVTLAAHSEFGRRVAENGSAGTDHGHGGIMLLLGGHVVGGQVHTTWPGLSPGNLDNGDLAITADYRDVMGEVLVQRMQCPDLSAVFPGHTPSFPGLVL